MKRRHYEANASEYQTPLRDIPGIGHEPTAKRVYDLDMWSFYFLENIIENYEKRAGQNETLTQNGVVLAAARLSLADLKVLSDKSDDEPMVLIAVSSFRDNQSHPIPEGWWDPESKELVVLINTAYTPAELDSLRRVLFRSLQTTLAHEICHATDPLLDRPSYAASLGAMLEHRYLHDENEVRARVYEIKARALIYWAEQALVKDEPVEDTDEGWERVFSDAQIHRYENKFSDDNWASLKKRVRSYVVENADEFIRLIQDVRVKTWGPKVGAGSKRRKGKRR